MAKTKDGFYKDYGVLSDNYVLLASGGHKKYGNETDDIPVSNGTMNVDLFAEYAQKLKPLYEQTYIHTCTSDNDANGYIFFGNVKPTSGYWQEPWEIYYTLVVNTPNANCQGVYDVIISAAGTTITYHIYNRFYSTSYLPIYNHILLWHDSQSKYNNRATYPTKIGVRVRDAYNVTSLQRTYNIKVWKLTNCEFEFPSNIELRGSVYNSTNNALTELNGTDVGLQETGDVYDTTTMQLAYSGLQAGTNGIKQYSLIMQDGTGKWQSFTSGSGTGTSKAKNTSGFRLGSRIYYVNRGSDLAANGYLDNSNVRTYQALIDFRYILNITANSLGNGLTYNKPIFIVGKINDTDGLFYLNDTWWTQDEPTSEDGNIYIRVAEAVYPDYNTSSMPTGNYRADFLSDGYAFYYTERKIKKYGSGDSNYRLYIGVGNAASSALVTNPYIKLFCSTKLKDQYQIIGSGATTVQSDNNGNITISSTDNKVTQTLIDSSNTNSRPLIIGYSSSNANPRSFSSTTNTVYATYNMYVDPADGRLTLYALNNLFIGTGTAATTSGSNYIPAKWTYNKGIIPKDGDIFTIKMPVDGHDYGVFISLNNGTNYYPVVLNGTGRLTTHYPNGTYLLIVFEGAGQANSIFPVAGGTSRTNVSGGAFRVLNYYDSTDITNMYLPYSQLKAGTGGIKENSLVMQAGDGTWQSFTTNNGVGTSKSKNTTGFRLGSRIYYTSNGNIAANSNMGTWVLRAYVANIDFRYSTNCGTTLTANKPLYIVGTINTSNGLFYLDDTWWTQNEPTSANGKIYIRVCEATYNTYQGDLVSDGYAFWFKNGKFQRYGLGTAEDIPKALISKGTTATATAGEVYGIVGNATSGSRIPTRWFVNLDNGDKTLKDGMIISFRLPTAGLDTVGECITIDSNQQNFHQVVYNTNSKLTTHFGINSVITLQYDATISCDMYGMFDSSTSTYVQNGNTTTSVTGVWRLLTLYDSGNDDTKVTQTATTTDANYEILFSATADNTTRTETARKTNKLLYNPSTNLLTNLGNIKSNDILPNTDLTYNLGSSTFRWLNMYASTFHGDLDGNASTASKWKTSRTLELTGSVTGSASIDGSGNISIATTTNHNHDNRYYTETESDGRYVKLDAGAAEQTIKNSIGSLSNGSIEIWRATAGGYPMIGFSNGTTKTKLGFLGFGSSANIPIFRNTSGSDYQLLHTGNTGLYVGGSGDLTANAAQTTNGNVYLTLKAGSTYFKHNIAGGTGISVTSDANGKITITNTAPVSHWTTGLYVGASNTQSNASTTNGNTYIKLYDDNTRRSEFKITGSGATTVSSDANGNITISSTDTDTNTHWTTGLYIGASNAKSNAAVTNPYLKLYDDSTRRSEFRITGSGATTVSSDANGNITISSTNNNTDTKVTQSLDSSNAEYRLLLKYSANKTDETQTAKYGNDITYNPYTKALTTAGDIILKSSTTNVMTYAGNVHAKIRFDNGDSSQNIAILFTDYDNYRAPAGLKIVGNQGNEWLEVDGNLYSDHHHPNVTNSFDFGTNDYRWRTLYLKGGINYIMDADTSNVKSPLYITNTSNSQIAEIMYHNTGDTNGAFIITPYAHSGTNAWSGTIGLYIGKNNLRWENKYVLRYSATATSGKVLVASGTIGDVITSAYNLNATINSGVTNRMAWYNTANSITYANNIYASNTQLTINGTSAPANSGNFQVLGTSTMSTIYLAGGSTYYINSSAVAYFNDLRSDSMRLVDNFIGWYSGLNATGNRYGYISADASYLYFRKENGNSGFNFNGHLVPSSASSYNVGTSELPFANLYLGKTNGSGIYYVGSKATFRMIRFIDNTADTYGNGISIGGGGLTVLGSGESADTILSNLSLTSSGGTENTYIGADGTINFYPSINSWDAAGLIQMTAGRLWVGVNGNTTRENQIGLQSGAGQILMYAHAATSGSRGMLVTAHGTGSARIVFNVDTNNKVTFADAYNGTATALAYSQSALALSSITYFACWNGYELRAINKSQLDGRYVKIPGDGRFSQYNQGTWTRILQFNITSGSLQPSITFEWHPTECARDAWSKFNINIRGNDIIFTKIRFGGANRTIKCVGNGTQFNVWVQGTKTGWDPYGLLQVVATYAINSYNTTLAYQDAEPSSTYNKFADIGGYVAYSNNSDMVDGYHASGLFETFSNAGSQTTRIKIGGTQKDLKIDADQLDGYHASGFFRYEGWWTSGSGQNVNDAEGMVFVYSNHGSPHGCGVLSTFSYQRGSSYKMQLFSDGYNDGYTYYRNKSSDRGGWGDWIRFIDSKNYTEYVNPKATSKTIWGQTYIDANGNFQNVNGLIKITANSKTLTLGAQNSSWYYFSGSDSSPFYFSNSSSFNGNVYPYTNNTYTLGTTSNRWKNVYIGTANSYGSATNPIYWNDGIPKACTYNLNATVNSGVANRIAWYNTATSITYGTITTDGAYLGAVSYLSINTAHQTSYRLYVTGSQRIQSGSLQIYPTGGNFNDGIRIHARSSDSTWGALMLCGADNTGDTGTSTNSWFIANQGNGNFYITRNGSTTSSNAMISCVSNIWYFQTGSLWKQQINGNHIIVTSRSAAADPFEGSAIEVREVNLVQTAQSSVAYSPKLGFHWGGRYSAFISLHEYRFKFFASGGTTSANYRPICAGSLGGTWIDGLRYENAAFNVGDATNTSSYWPWLRQTNTASGYWFSLGQIGTSMRLITSTTSRTSNDYDRGVVWEASNGQLTVDRGTTNQMFRLYTSNTECSIHYNRASGTDSWTVGPGTGGIGRSFGWWNGAYNAMYLEAVGRLWVGRNANDGERRIGVDHSTSRTLYMWANGSEKGLFSGAGYRAGYILRIRNENTSYYGQMVSIGGFGDGANMPAACSFNYHATYGDFYGSSGWCHYLICNHGNGASYYNYVIGLPFGGVPKYKRQTGSTSSTAGWYNFITEENLGNYWWANQHISTTSNSWTTPMFGSIYPAQNASWNSTNKNWNGCDIGSEVDHCWRNIWTKNLTITAKANEVPFSSNTGYGTYGTNARQNNKLYAAGQFEFKGLGGAHTYFTSNDATSTSTTYYNYLYVGFVLDPINYGNGNIGMYDDYFVFGAVGTTEKFKDEGTAQGATDASTSGNYGFGFISIPCAGNTTTAFGQGGGRLYFGGYDHGGSATHFPRDTDALHGFSFFDYKSQLWSWYSHLNYSDSRLKSNIESVTNNPKLNEIYQWAKTAFVQYTLPSYEEEQTIQNNINSDIENSDYYYYHEYEKPHYGVIAQNLHTILPELTSLDPHFNVWAVNYNELHNILFAALIKQIEDLKQEIEQLKNGNT